MKRPQRHGHQQAMVTKLNAKEVALDDLERKTCIVNAQNETPCLQKGDNLLKLAIEED